MATWYKKLIIIGNKAVKRLYIFVYKYIMLPYHYEPDKILFTADLP